MPVKPNVLPAGGGGTIPNVVSAGWFDWEVPNILPGAYPQEESARLVPINEEYNAWSLLNPLTWGEPGRRERRARSPGDVRGPGVRTRVALQPEIDAMGQASWSGLPSWAAWGLGFGAGLVGGYWLLAWSAGALTIGGGILVAAGLFVAAGAMSVSDDPATSAAGMGLAFGGAWWLSSFILGWVPGTAGTVLRVYGAMSVLSYVGSSMALAD